MKAWLGRRLETTGTALLNLNPRLQGIDRDGYHMTDAAVKALPESPAEPLEWVEGRGYVRAADPADTVDFVVSLPPAPGIDPADVYAPGGGHV